MLDANGRVTVKEIAYRANISSGTADTILVKHLAVYKVSARWIPHMIYEQQNQQCLETAQKLLKTYGNCDTMC